MPEMPQIDVRPDLWEVVRSILKKHVPQYAVWAFGSRAKWTAKQYSDLDLAVITNQPLPLAVSASLSDDFAESDLPWKVDIVDWATTSESFRKIIERDKMVVQEAGHGLRQVNKMQSLDSICSLIADCPHSTPVWTDSGFVVLRNQNIKNGRLDLSEPSFTDAEHFASRIQRAKPSAKDIVITREAPMGDVCMIPEGLECCLGQRQVLLRPNPEIADPKFVLYALQSENVQHQIGWNEGTGSTVSNLRIPVLKALNIPAPPIEEQRAIAHILGTLDDKIELNRRMNQTLEDMARALFKSWFVDFDGVAPQDMQESELGLIPKGWRVGTLADLCELKYGKALKATERRDGNIPVYGSGGITGYHDEPLISNPTIIVGRKGTIGSLSWESKPCFPIDTVFYVQPKVSLHYCYYAMTRLRLHNLNTDAAVPGLNRDNACRQEIIIPSAEALQSWDAFAVSIRAQLNGNDEQSQTLAQLRDTLLPKLISSELHVDSESGMHVE